MSGLFSAFILANLFTAASANALPPRKTLAVQLIHRCSPHGLLRSTFEPYELLEAVGDARYGLSASDRHSLLTCRMDQPARSTDSQP
jgi:hypothetical protein